MGSAVGWRLQGSGSVLPAWVGRCSCLVEFLPCLSGWDQAGQGVLFPASPCLSSVWVSFLRDFHHNPIAGLAAVVFVTVPAAMRR